MLIANILKEPKNMINKIIVVIPFGASPGATICSIISTMAKIMVNKTKANPKVLNISSGLRLKENIPFFAQPIFLKKLLLERPNIRSGRIYSTPICLNPT